LAVAANEVGFEASDVELVLAWEPVLDLTAVQQA